jgi:CMP-N-acetylneuraminic acid synthetase
MVEVVMYHLLGKNRKKMKLLVIKNNVVINIVEGESVEKTKQDFNESYYDDIVLYVSQENVWETYGYSIFFPEPPTTELFVE